MNNHRLQLIKAYSLFVRFFCFRFYRYCYPVVLPFVSIHSDILIVQTVNLLVNRMFVYRILRKTGGVNVFC